MTWLLGSIAGVGVAGIVALALAVIRMASANRADLKDLIRLMKVNTEIAALLAATENAKQDLDHVLFQRTDERDREHLARVATEELLESALVVLTRRSDAAGVVADLRGHLGRLSEIVMPSAERALTPDLRGGGKTVHGETSSDSDPADQ